MEFGETAFPKFGTGQYLQQDPTVEATLEFGDFSAGYFSPVNREMVPENTTPYAQDIEVTRNNRLKRSPGTTVLEIFEVRSPDHIVVHGSLDFTAELLLFDFPYMGVKRFGDTEWANKNLLDTGWFAWANFGGTFIFTDGDKVYARQVNDGTNLTELTEAPVSLAYASWAGRMWGLASVIDAQFEPMGVVWSAANSDYTDWDGVGSGFELLIDQISSGDRGVALVPMGLDFMAIFLRKSIWIARRTGLSDRPGDFQPRVPGIGAINDRCIQATPEGVIFVCDDRVELFDGNTSTHISYQIDAELLPLDYGEILNYTSSYNPSTKRYYLHTPAGITWIYELEFKRWMRRSLEALESVIWPLQAESAVVEGKNRVVFLGDHIEESLSERSIEVEDQASELYFGQPQDPIWTLRPTPQVQINRLLTSKSFNLEYEGVADIELWAPNNFGVFEALVIDGLISQSPPDVVNIPAAKTGRLAALQLRITRGDAEFIHLQVIYIERGPRVALGEGGIPGNFPERTSLQVFPQGSVAAWTGGAGGPQRPVLTVEVEQISLRTYQFSLAGSSPDYPIDGWIWDFGDGTTSAEASPTHTYDEFGTYEVTVEAKSDWYSFGYYPINLLVEDTGEVVTTSYYADEEGTWGLEQVRVRPLDGGAASLSLAWDLARAQQAPATGVIALEDDDGLYLYANRHSGFSPPYGGTIRRLLLLFDTLTRDFDPLSGRVKIKVRSLADYGDVLPYSEYPDFGFGPSPIETTWGLVVWLKPDPDTLITEEDPLVDVSLRAGSIIPIASADTHTFAEMTNGAVLTFELNAVALEFLTLHRYVTFAIMSFNDLLGDSYPTGWLTALPSIGINIKGTEFYSPYSESTPDRMFPILELDHFEPNP